MQHGIYSPQFPELAHLIFLSLTNNQKGPHARDALRGIQARAESIFFLQNISRRAGLRAAPPHRVGMPGPEPSVAALIGAACRNVKGEDRMAVRDSTIAGERVVWMLVSDGHGGATIAALLADELLALIVGRTKGGSMEHLHEAVQASFVEMHKKALALHSCTSGATLTVCALNLERNELATWNVGDSVGLLIHDNGYEHLCSSHRLNDSVAERERVSALGAKLAQAQDQGGGPSGPLRCWPGGLAIARVIGDSDCAEYVSAIPHISEPVAPVRGGAVVLCTDGVWDVLTSEEVANIVYAGKYDSAATAAHRVVRAAAKRGLVDDASCVVMLFGPSSARLSGGDGAGDGEQQECSPRLGKAAAYAPAAQLRGLSALSAELDPEDEALPPPRLPRPVVKDNTTKGGTIFINAHTSSVYGTRPDVASTKMIRSSARLGSAPAAASASSPGLDAMTPAFLAAPPPTAPAATGYDQSPHLPGQAPAADPLANYSLPSVAQKRGLRRMTLVLTNQFDIMLAAARGTSTGATRPSNGGSDGARSPPGARSPMNDSGTDERRSGFFRRPMTAPDSASSPRASPSSKRMSDAGGSPDAGGLLRQSWAALTGTHSNGDSGHAGNVFSELTVRTDLFTPAVPWKGKAASFPELTRSLRPGALAPANLNQATGLGETSRNDAEDKLNGVEDLGASFHQPGPYLEQSSRTRQRMSALVASSRRKEAGVAQYEDFGPMVFLGQGEFATAWRTSLDGKEVAVKMLKPEKKEQTNALAGLKREIMLMTLMDHPNILPGRALGQREGKPFMVLDLLSSVLVSELPRSAESVPFWVRWREVKRWPLSRAIKCARQLGEALRYCHHEAFPKVKVLHRDIKPANIGFLADGTLVLFDFGLASLWTDDEGEGPDPDATRALTGETGSLRYMAPEVALSKPYNHKAEVFSWASVFWEMITFHKPYEAYTPDIFLRAIGQGITPEVRKKWPLELRDMLTACWSLESAKRPDFRTIVPRLSTMLEAQEIRELPKKERKRLQEAGKLSPRATPGGHEGGVRKRIDADIETMDS